MKISLSKTLSALVMLIALNSCSPKVSRTEVMNSWVGKTYQELILGIGPPNETTTDGNGGTTAIYYESSRAYVPGKSGISTVGSDNKVTISGGTTGYYKTSNNRYCFYINSDNTIYSWRIN